MGDCGDSVMGYIPPGSQNYKVGRDSVGAILFEAA